MNATVRFAFLIAAAGTFLAAGPPAMAAGTVYVPLGGAGEILVIDAAADRVIDRIPGLEAAHGLASTSAGDFLVVGSIAETTAGEPTLPPKPQGMSAEQHQAHHAGANDTAGAISYVSIVATAGNSVVRRIEVPGAVHHTAVTPDGRYAIATHPNNGGISVIDLAAGKLRTTVKTGPMPNYAVASGDGTRVYVSNAGNDTVSEIDTASWTLRRNFRVGETPEHMVLSPDDGTLYVNNTDAGTVSAVSVGDGRVVATFEVGGQLHGVDLSDDGKTLFVSAREQNRLVAIDVESGAIRSAALAPAPYHLTAVGGTGKLYVSSAEAAKLWVIDQKSLRTLNEIPIRGKGHQMAVVAR